MKKRTGKECKKKNCKNYEFYSNAHFKSGFYLCTDCKNAYVSQYERKLT